MGAFKGKDEMRTHYLNSYPNGKKGAAANLSIETDDFDYVPFSQQGGLGRMHQVFGDDLQSVIEGLNEALAAEYARKHWRHNPLSGRGWRSFA